MSKKKTKEARFTYGGFLVKGFKAALLLELGGVLGSYIVWKQLNTNQGKLG